MKKGKVIGKIFGIALLLTLSVGLVMAPLGKVGAATEEFSSSGTFTFTVPWEVSQITVEAWGGGGAGGGSDDYIDCKGAGGAGGGGGAYASSTLSVTPGITLKVVVGAGGTGVSGANGTDGGSSFVGPDTDPDHAFVRAAGGSGGTANTVGGQPSGGAGGTIAASVGDTRLAGENGEDGDSGGLVWSGDGGDGANGGSGGAGFDGAENKNGYPGTAPGGGGGGGRTQGDDGGAHAGGAGADGRVVIAWVAQPPLVLECAVSPNPTRVGHVTNFLAAASGRVPPYSWSWTIDGTEVATTQNTTHIFATAGTYNVCVNVTDSLGNKKQCCTNVTVNPALSLVLLPETDTNPVGTTHRLTAAVYDQFDNVMEGVNLIWSISGVGSFSGTPESPTDVNGEADAVITSSEPGTSTVRCEVTGNTLVFDTATKIWTYEENQPQILPVPYYSQGDSKWCVPTSMSMIFKYYDKPVHLWDIAKDWDLKIDKVLNGWREHSKVEKYFEDRGLSPADTEIDFDAIKHSIDSDMPVFISMHNWNPLHWLHHAVVIVGYEEVDGRRIVYVHDPSGVLAQENIGQGRKYIAREVEWSQLAQYCGKRSYAISIGGEDPSPPNGTIDFFNPSPSHQVVFQQIGALSGYCYSLYDRERGLIWECSQPYPLVFDSDDKLRFFVAVANHMDRNQMYTFEVEFTKKVDEFHWLSFSRIWDVAVDGRNTAEVNDVITLRDIIGEYGEYTVTLRLLDSGCVKTYDEIVFPSIKYGPLAPPIADFTASRTSGRTPLFVLFTDHSTGDIDSWLWDFGDGRTSTGQNPFHVYTRPGVYTVKLTVSGPVGEDTEVKENYIEVRSWRTSTLP